MPRRAQRSTEAIGNPSSQSRYSCTSCRRRKLKCDRNQTGCQRCRHFSIPCEYLARKKAIRSKQIDLQVLAGRISKIEGSISGLASGAHSTNDNEFTSFKDVDPKRQEHNTSSSSSSSLSNWNICDLDADELPLPWQSDYLIDYSTWTSPCPFESMPELNDIFFASVYPAIPILHPTRYRQAMNTGLCDTTPIYLYYAVWALAALSEPKFRKNASGFYQQARRYFDVVEEKNLQITFAYAQTSVLLAMYEAMTMMFNKASISTARSVRICQLLHLDKLDAHNSSEFCRPRTDLFDIEEARRVFWVAFTFDCHSFIFGGTQPLLCADTKLKIRTRLPCSEQAFTRGLVETASFLHESLLGSPFDGFAATVVTCEIYKQILKHTLTSDLNNGEWDFVAGNFWKRHYFLDGLLNRLSSTLPAGFNLPAAFENPSAVIFNVNLQSAIISLHHAAVGIGKQFCLPSQIIEASRTKLIECASKIAAIIETNPTLDILLMSPLCAVSIYCASTVYIREAELAVGNEISDIDKLHLETILNTLSMISRIQPFAVDFAALARREIERVGLKSGLAFPTLHDVVRPLNSGEVGLLDAPLFIRVSMSKYRATNVFAQVLLEMNVSL